MMAVWKAGGTYVPVDAEWPIGRQQYVFQDTGTSLVLVNTDESPTAPSEPPRIVVQRSALGGSTIAKCDAAIHPSDAAYIMYTSGSSGHPKGVVVEHRSLTQFLSAMQATFTFEASDVFPVLASPSFDIMLFELLCILVRGGTALLLSRQAVLDAPTLAASLRTATVLHAVPSLMRILIAHVNAREMFEHKLRMIFIGGDVVPAPLLDELNRLFPATQIVVLYGPTEATIVCTSYAVPRGRIPDRYIIGKALGHCCLRLSHEDGGLVPTGAIGEIYLAGGALAREYLNAPVLTKEKFTTIDGHRCYRSGDLGRRLADGNIEFLGRRDQQVKIRGIRIELGEIEVALQAYPGVRHAAVLLEDHAPDDKRLVAYLVAAADIPAGHDLRAFLRKRLPQSMIPAKFVLLEHLPLSPHGKVDRQALAGLGGMPIVERRSDAPPRTQVEEAIAEIWKEVLDVQEVDVEQNFFELGGHSLLLLQAHARLSGLFGMELSVIDMFRYPTIRSLAEYVEDRREPSFDRSRRRGMQRRERHNASTK
jgi:amino acid adenylation domain-containing protein